MPTLYERIKAGEFLTKVDGGRDANAHRRETVKLGALFRQSLREEFGKGLCKAIQDDIEQRSHDATKIQGNWQWAEQYEELADFARMIISETRKSELK